MLSLYAKGLTTGEICAHFAEVYGASVSKDTVCRITDRVIEEMQAWWARPLEKVYAAVFIDAIMVKVRDGQVRNRPVYAAIGVDLDGHKDILGMWAGDGDGESAKFWMAVLTDLKNRGVKDVFFLVCDGLKGLPDRVNAVFPPAIVQTCIIHLIRGTFRYASRKYWDQLSKDLQPIYQPPNADAPRPRWTSWRTSGAPGTRRSSGCGATPGRSSSRSWTTEPVAEWRAGRRGFEDPAVPVVWPSSVGAALACPGCGQASWARWILRRLKAVAARWSSLVGVVQTAA